MQAKCIQGIREGKKSREINKYRETYFSSKITSCKGSLAGSIRNTYSSPHEHKLVEKRETKLVEQEYSWETSQSVFSEREEVVQLL